MFELTNEQRECFGLDPIDPHWKRVNVVDSPSRLYNAYAYVDGTRIMRVIFEDEAEDWILYEEFSVNASLNEDLTKILPITGKGKPRTFNHVNLENMSKVGMHLHNTDISNETTGFHYVTKSTQLTIIKSFSDLIKWYENWCEETTEADKEELRQIANAPKKAQKYKAGDFFRFKLTRRLYGYGRVLFDYDKLNKGKEHWDNIFYDKRICVTVYHIITEDKDLKPEDLQHLKELPSVMIHEYALKNGYYQIIGNLPLTDEHRDYPIHYGTPYGAQKVTCFQQGDTYIKLDKKNPLFRGFHNNDSYFYAYGDPQLYEILDACIKAGSNDPYWEMISPYSRRCDLRKPSSAKMLHQILQQVGLEE